MVAVSLKKKKEKKERRNNAVTLKCNAKVSGIYNVHNILYRCPESIQLFIRLIKEILEIAKDNPVARTLATGQYP